MKKDGGTRPCVDFRRLNAQTLPDAYPLPRIDDLLSRAKGSWFTTLDLKNGYYQIPVAPEDIPKTAVTTPFGLFEYIRMPFGLRNAAPTFQRFMDYILRGLEGVQVYIDDILIASNSPEAHLHLLERVLSRLHDAGLRVNSEKSVWMKDQVNYLGHIISSKGYAPSLDRISKLLQQPPPEDIQQLRRVLGMLNFYRSHIPNFASKATLLYQSLKQFSWTKDHNACLSSLKEDLARGTLLRQPRLDLPFTIHTDASGNTVGASITQNNHPVAFYSCNLTEVERRYSTFDKEALAIFKVVKAYRHWFTGSKITVYSDHKPLLPFLAMKSPSPRQARWSTFLSEFDLEILHISGSENIVADCLSRPPPTQQCVPNTSTTQLRSCLNQICLGINNQHPWYSILSNFTPDAKEYSYSELQLKKLDGLWYSTSTFRPRLLVPVQLRKEVFSMVHEQFHPGFKKTICLIAERFLWPNMRKEVKSFCMECLICQAAKVTRHQHHDNYTISASSRFQSVHIDLVGPLPASHTGATYLFTMVDKFSRWVEAVPLRDISARTCIDVFINTWIARFGLPESLTSDQGRQFESAVFNGILEKLGIKHIRTTAYHPQSNATVERFHRTLKNALRSLCGDSTNEWENHLPWILLGIRTSISAPTQVPPCKLVLGSDITLPIDLLLPTPNRSVNMLQSEFLKKIEENMAVYSNVAQENQPVTTTPHVPPTTEWIWLKDETRKSSLNKPYTGPYKVMGQSGPVIKILGRGGNVIRVNIDRTKPLIKQREFAESNTELQLGEPRQSVSADGNNPKDVAIPQEEAPITPSPVHRQMDHATHTESEDTAILQGQALTAPIPVQIQMEHTTRYGRLIKQPIRYNGKEGEGK
jgi:cleavage and polyadenylation specificity factor subunit 1